MWRSMFLAAGLYACLLGGECMVIDRAVLANRTVATGDGTGAGVRDLKPAEWAPWSFLSGGAVVMLYSFTIPKKWKD